MAPMFIVVTQTDENRTPEGGWETVYHWDGAYWPSHDDAITAGWNVHGPDFSIGRVEDGELVWFGWMLNHLPDSDLLEISHQLGLSVHAGSHTQEK